MIHPLQNENWTIGSVNSVHLRAAYLFIKNGRTEFSGEIEFSRYLCLITQLHKISKYYKFFYPSVPLGVLD